MLAGQTAMFFNAHKLHGSCGNARLCSSKLGTSAASNPVAGARIWASSLKTGGWRSLHGHPKELGSKG
jgi:hypothetical protein